MSGLLGTDPLTTTPTCTVPDEHTTVDTYPITCSGADAGGNYDLSYATGTLSVTAAPVVIIADNQAMVYGGVTPTLTATPTGLMGTDTLTTEPICAVEGAPTDVGTHPITCSGAAVDGNYSLSYASGTLTITPAAVVVVAPSPDDRYGTPATAIALAPTLTGLVNGDTQSTAGLDSVSCTTTAVATAGGSYPAGTYPLICTGPSSTKNYTVSYLEGALRIVPAVLIVTAGDQTRAYDTATAPLNATVTGLVNGDDSRAISGAAAVTTTGTLLSPEGTYPVTAAQGTLSAPNYTFAFRSGTLTITRGVVVITQTTLPDGAIGRPYHATLRATGGLAPYVWAIIAGTLPPGLTLDPATGTISGTPSGTATKVEVTIQATDSEGIPSSTATVFRLLLEAAAVVPVVPVPVVPVPVVPVPVVPVPVVPVPVVPVPVPSTNALPSTGIDAASPMAVAFLLLLTGAGSMFFGRRRRPNQS